MKNSIWLGLLIILFNNCKFQNESIDKTITSSSLLKILTEFINHVDSVRNTNGFIESILITFSENDNKCYVLIEGDFIYYDSKAMNGYFRFKDKAISVYGINTECGNELINLNNLKKEKIEGLIDYDYSQLTDKNLRQPPLPPPPPREPYFRKYLIVNKDNLKLIDKYKY